jgi:hypothetical protein
MRRAAFVCALLYCLTAPAFASASPTIYLVNESKALSNPQLQNALPALQAQISQDFEPVWNLDAKLVIGPAPDRGWRVFIQDSSDVPGALGYHDVCEQDGLGYPCAFVGAQTTLDAGLDPMGTLSHELLEMIADPYVSTCQKVGRRFYVQEVCDAPESEVFGYTRPGVDGSPVILSDFVTPFFFRPGHAGPYDFTRHIFKPLQVLTGGYISWWQDGLWHQVFKRLRAL